jgi:hypothetical protein
MGIFSKEKEKTIYHSVESYYIIDNRLFEFSMNDMISEDDKQLSNVELFNKYGFEVNNVHSIGNSGNIEVRYSSFVELPFDMDSAQYVGDSLPDAIDILAELNKKKFEEFHLDGTVYTCSVYNLENGHQNFRTIVKPIRKLIDTGCPKGNVLRPYILEVEVLDGISASTYREFMPFYEFLLDYEEGQSLEVVDNCYDCEQIYSGIGYFKRF